MAGLFDTYKSPEEVQRGITQEGIAQDRAAPTGWKAISSAAAGGGRMLGQALGGQDPRITKAQAIQKVQQDLMNEGWESKANTPEFFQEIAIRVRDIDPQMAMQASMQGKELERTLRKEEVNIDYKEAMTKNLGLPKDTREPSVKLYDQLAAKFGDDKAFEIAFGDKINKGAKQAAKDAAAAAKDSFKKADTLRDEYTASSKDFVKVRDAHNRVVASAKDPSAAGDLALIFNYMKVLDPGSVVRESEFATAAASGSLGSRIQAAMNKIGRGERMDETMRADFLNRSEKLHNEMLKSQKRLMGSFNKLADRFKVSRENVVIDYTTPEEQPLIPPSAPSPTEQPTALGGGVPTLKAPPKGASVDELVEFYGR